MITGHGGNIFSLARRLGCVPDEILDMSSNVNPLGPPPGLVEFLSVQLERINALPEPDASMAISAFADHHRVAEERVVGGNGTTQLIYTLPLALGSRRAVILGPTYADYADACAMYGVPFQYHLADESRDFRPDLAALEKDLAGADTVFICNPDNPTGVLIPAEDLLDLCRRNPEVRFIIDESYLPFVEEGEKESLLGRDLDNVLVLHSMSKIFRVPGLRIGFAVAPEPLIKKIGWYAQPWAMNSLAQAAVLFLMGQRVGTGDFIRKTRQILGDERRTMEEKLGSFDQVRPIPGKTAFLLVRLPPSKTADEVWEALAQERILIRNCGNFIGLSERYIRISLKTPEENRMVLEKLTGIL